MYWTIAYMAAAVVLLGFAIWQAAQNQRTLNRVSRLNDEAKEALNETQKMLQDIRDRHQMVRTVMVPATEPTILTLGDDGAWEAGQDYTIARLPHDLIEDTIERMKIGDRGWTVPWAVIVDNNLNMWLRPTYTVHREPGGTVSMIVSRNEDGFVVQQTPGDWGRDRNRKYQPEITTEQAIATGLIPVYSHQQAYFA